jgi:hypothetical protein
VRTFQHQNYNGSNPVPPSCGLNTNSWLFCTLSISRLEHLDEIEELELVLAHYSITWGYSNRIGSGADHPVDVSLDNWALPLQTTPTEDVD